MFLSRLIDYTKLKGQLANGITLMNLSFGILAVMSVVKDHHALALLFILLAASFDRFDGMVARKFNTESDFGKELDSLCDLVSFGVAPAILIYQSSLYQVPAGGLTLTVLFILCGAVRLAKFNVKEFDGVFYGVPITAAGVILSLCYFLLPYLNILFIVLIISILTILMVSPIKIAKM